MKSRPLVGLCVAAGCFAVGGGFLGCGSSGGSGGPTPDAGPDATTDSGAGVDSAAGDTGTGGGDTGAGGGDAGDSGVSDSSTGGDTGAGDSGFVWDGSTALDCTNYCGFLIATCTGVDQQYQTVQECLNACSLLPLGMATDTSGDSIGCRMYHTQLAATMGKNPHCWHAGPYGFGACGMNCDNFCLLATQWCSGADGFEGGTPPYSNLGNCTSAMQCPSFALADAGGDPGAYNAAGPQSGNTLDCREWHLGAALADHAAQQIHCFHVGKMAIGTNPFPCQ